MTSRLLAELGAVEVETVQEQVRLAHARLRREQCAVWQHAMAYPGKEGGCDIHPVEEQ